MEVGSLLSSCNAFLHDHLSSLTKVINNLRDENMLTQQRCVIRPKDLQFKDHIFWLDQHWIAYVSKGFYMYFYCQDIKLCKKKKCTAKLVDENIYVRIFSAPERLQ